MSKPFFILQIFLYKTVFPYLGLVCVIMRYIKYKRWSNILKTEKYISFIWLNLKPLGEFSSSLYFFFLSFMFYFMEVSISELL